MNDPHLWAWVKEFPPFLSTLFMSMIPITENRIAIPVGLRLGLPWYFALLAAILGNIIPVIVILFGIESLSRVLMNKYNYWHRFFTWLFSRTRKKYEKGFHQWGPIALIIFVAIPLPFSGGYSGAVASFVLGIKPQFGMGYILLGLIISGTIVTLFSLGIFRFIGL